MPASRISELPGLGVRASIHSIDVAQSHGNKRICRGCDVAFVGQRCHIIVARSAYTLFIISSEYEKHDFRSAAVMGFMCMRHLLFTVPSSAR
jgi:hypothetical protein